VLGCPISCPVCPRWRLIVRPCWQFTGSSAVASGGRRIGVCFLSLMAIGWARYSLLRGGGFGAFWLILLGWFGLGLPNQTPAALAEGGDARTQMGDAACVAFGCWNLIASLRRPQPAAASATIPPCPLDWGF